MNDACIDNGVLRILYDSQVNLVAGGFSQHLHTIQRILTRAGAERAAHFSVEFDPTSQQVDVHFVRVCRADLQIDHATRDSFQLLRREKKFEQLTLDGRLTATLLIPDLRIDDVLDVSLTVTTNNPVTGGLYNGWIIFNALAPWIECRHRLRGPLHRKIAQKTFCDPPDGIITSADEVPDSRWTLIHQTRLEPEEFTPPWQIQHPCVQVSEFRDWNQVARLFAAHYEASELPPELSIEIDRIAKATADPAERAAEWLRFVQKQLRYFALSLGDGGLVPRDLDTIWSRRFGDCKDGSRLFVAGADRLGIDACAALTSTTHGRVLDGLLPSLNVFDHCIVRVRIDGRTYWLDPTMPRQEGRLSVIYQPHSGWALPLTQDTIALEHMAGDEPIVYRHTDEVLTLGPRPDSPAALELRVHYHSFAADALRHRFENEGHSKFAEQVGGELRTTWPDLVERAPMTLHDDLASNRLLATFNYEIRNPWKAVDTQGRLGFKVTAGSIATELNPLKKLQRRTDVYLGRPRKATWQARMLMPRRWSGNGWTKSSTAVGMRYTNLLAISAREICLERELSISHWSIPPSEADSYQALVGASRENVVTIMGRVTFGRIGPAAGRLSALKRRPMTLLWLLFWGLYSLWFLYKLVTDNP
jgi:transglutaminase-like putative cysteine protease